MQKMRTLDNESDYGIFSHFKELDNSKDELVSNNET